jgi:hypothetical protein
MIFGYIFTGLSIAIALFPLVLALGAPLGEFTLGGKYPGKLPVKLRIAALLQILILFIFNMIVLSKAGLAFDFMSDFSRIAVWFVFAFFILGSIMNLSSPSKKEKIVMGPLNIIALICTFILALA